MVDRSISKRATLGSVDAERRRQTSCTKDVLPMRGVPITATLPLFSASPRVRFRISSFAASDKPIAENDLSEACKGVLHWLPILLLQRFIYPQPFCKKADLN